MAVYDVAIDGDTASAETLQCIRGLTDLSLSDIRRRIADGAPIVSWDADDFALTGDRESNHRSIIDAIDRLRATGCQLRFLYRPAARDGAEAVTYTQIFNLMASDRDYDQQEHD